MRNYRISHSRLWKTGGIRKMLWNTDKLQGNDSLYLLSDAVAAGPKKLVSTWNVATLNEDVFKSIKLMPDFKDLVHILKCNTLFKMLVLVTY